ncbi:hypothetical protein [Peribacillus glennii]|uniref:Uncharacterized protein n=1 Tax=Peribacillus glennii TaxID=2303991 RepID=A0A372L866_9BACI|nr:hypothetical protein [Peribacillus glennii]RFU60523.1 hypothetical protein D0466_21095 [Peribacillus glennii]
MSDDKMERIERVRFYEFRDDKTGEPIDFIVLRKGENPMKVAKSWGLKCQIHRFTTWNPELGAKIHYWYNRNSKKRRKSWRARFVKAYKAFRE